MNIVKNAVEAIEEDAKKSEHDGSGEIDALLDTGSSGEIRITITDNGIGLPEARDAIAEPYMTTRQGGTGLGLAIVKKIVEQHYGEDRKSVVSGTSVSVRVDLGGRRIIKKKKKTDRRTNNINQLTQ